MKIPVEDPLKTTPDLEETAPDLSATEAGEPKAFDVTEPMIMRNVTIIVQPNDMAGTEETTPEDLGATGSGTPDEFGMTGDSAGSRRRFFSDSISVKLDTATAEKTLDGYTKFPGVMIAKAMVQTYQDIDGSYKQVLKSPDALQAMIEFGELRPITDEHPKDGVVMDRDETRGFIENLLYNDGATYADLVVKCPHLLKKINDGKNEVSIGFYSTTTDNTGIFNDAPYQQIQERIWLDHVAIVSRGRCSLKHGCGITDAVKQKVIVIKTKDAPKMAASAPAKAADNAIDNHARSRILGEISLVTDSDVPNELMGLNLDQLKAVRSIVKQTKGPTLRMDSTTASARDVVDNAYQEAFG